MEEREAAAMREREAAAMRERVREALDRGPVPGPHAFRGPGANLGSPENGTRERNPRPWARDHGPRTEPETMGQGPGVLHRARARCAAPPLDSLSLLRCTLP